MTETVTLDGEPECRDDIPECICADESGQTRTIGVFKWGTFCATCGGRV